MGEGKPRRQHLYLVGAAILASLLVGGVFILAAGKNPFTAYYWLLRAGYGCEGFGGFCALLTALQYSTPLILGGLSATFAFRAGLFSIGQFGQMVFGAAAATWIAGTVPWPRPLLLLTALLGAVAAGGLWGIIPGLLKTYLGINEVIVTLMLNPIAVAMVGPVSWWLVPEQARLLPLVSGTKLNAGFFIALGSVLFALAYFSRSSAGYELRMAGQASRFARFGGIRVHLAVIQGMALSGAFAGLAGAIEVIGVQYRFVSQFSAIDSFDGIIVALVGQLHPVGVMLGGLLLGGIRLGALNGLQLQAGVPRELGSALIALLVLFVSAPRLMDIRRFSVWPRQVSPDKDKQIPLSN